MRLVFFDKKKKRTKKEKKKKRGGGGGGGEDAYAKCLDTQIRAFFAFSQQNLVICLPVAKVLSTVCRSYGGRR